MTTFCSYLPLPTCSPIFLSSQLVLAPSSQGDQVGQRALEVKSIPISETRTIYRRMQSPKVGTIQSPHSPPHQDVTLGPLPLASPQTQTSSQGCTHLPGGSEG